jgi:hypothetical protein
LTKEMYELFYSKKEIAYKLFWKESHICITPVLIYIDKILANNIDPKIRENIRISSRSNNLIKDYSSETQSKRWKLWWRKSLNTKEISRLEAQRKNPLENSIRNNLYSLFKNRKTNNRIYTNWTALHINKTTEKQCYEILCEFLYKEHWIKKTPAALKSIITRLKKKDPDYSTQSNTSTNSPSTTSSQPSIDPQE